MHILWINNKASLKGGAEQYIYNTVDALNDKNFTSSLLYDPNDETQNEFFDKFDQAYPLVTVYDQIKQIDPDIIYIHQLDDYDTYKQIIKTKKPVIRFYHDHKLFCLREHKYTAITQTTCTKKVGAGCYSCLGFINKDDSPLGFSINSMAKLKKLQYVNRDLNHFIVGSDYMKKHLELHEFDQQKISVNPLYSSSAFTASNYNDFTSSKELLFVGQLINGKGLDALLKSMTKINDDYKLTIVGNGKQEEYFKHYAKELKLGNRANFVGKVTQEQLQKYYKRAYCLVVPSRAPETFNLTGIEAQKVGLPVVATNVGGISQWLENGVNGFLVKPNNIKDLYTKINNLIEDKSLHKKICFNIANDKYHEFEQDNHVNKLIDIFENQVGGYDV